MPVSDTWLVIPCFNEERRLPAAEVSRFVETSTGVHLCLVDDGSTDGTFALLSSLERAHPGRVTALRLDANRGKAEAVRAGILHGLDNGTHQCMGYWDADLATPFNQLALFAAESERTPEWEILMGCRHQRLGTDIRRKWMRHYVGRAFATLVSRMLDLPVYDTQCGAKLFRRETAAALFSRPLLTAWVFDVELLARYVADKGHSHALSHIREVPLDKWTDVGESKLSAAAHVRAIRDLAVIKRAYALKRGPRDI